MESTSYGTLPARKTTWTYGPQELAIPYCEKCHDEVISFKRRYSLFGWPIFIGSFFMTLFVIAGIFQDPQGAIAIFFIAIVLWVFITYDLSSYLAGFAFLHVIPSHVYSDLKQHAELHNQKNPYFALHKSKLLYSPGFSYRYLSSPPVTDYVAEVGITTPFAYDHFVRLNYFTDLEKHLSGKLIS